jgi:ABC-type transport system involved in cytochrome bd biosynthesis fused ATPase/permease subunit
MDATQVAEVRTDATLLIFFAPALPRKYGKSFAVLQNGRLAEPGSHDDLNLRNGLYETLHAASSRRLVRPANIRHSVRELNNDRRG